MIQFLDLLTNGGRMKSKDEGLTIAPVGSIVRAAAFLAGLAFAFGMSACTTTPTYPPAPKDAATADYNYHIGPLDVVNVIVWRNPELSMSVPVRPDGKLTTPLVDDLQALARQRFRPLTVRLARQTTEMKAAALQRLCHGADAADGAASSCRVVRSTSRREGRSPKCGGK